MKDQLLSLGLTEEQALAVMQMLEERQQEELALRGERDALRTQAEEYRAMAEQVRFDAALHAALVEARAKNQRAVSALLDKSLLRYHEGQILGLDEQLALLKAREPYLFESELGGMAFSGLPQEQNGNVKINSGIRKAARKGL